MSSQAAGRLLGFQGDTVLTAGAGAGKTTALVEFYLALVQGRVKGVGRLSCLDILALTYTEKAATEMKDRIREVLLLAGLTDQVELLDRASVETIHAFCARTLREFALEAGLDPEFSILDDPGLLAQSSAQAVIQALDRDDPAAALLLSYLPFQGRSGLQESLETSLRLARSTGQTKGELLSRLEQVETELPTLEKKCRLEFQAVMAELTGVELSPGLKSTPALQQIQELTGRPLDPDLAARIKAGLPSRLPRDLAPLKAELLRIINEYELLLSEPEGLAAARALVALMALVEEDYNSAKAAQAALDFDDLQLLTRDLLFENLQVRNRLKDRIRLILVDEFQDTNPLQWQIITCLQERRDRSRPLVPGQDPAQVLDLDRGRLLAVGDVKQSIYRFRGAEVEVFTRLKESLEQSDRGEVVSLGRNYRSQPGLVEFFNVFFSQRLGRARAGFQAGFSEEDQQRTARKGGSSGLVELLETDPGESQAATREREAAAVARRIKELVEEGSPVPIGGDLAGAGGRPRAAYGEVVILLRKLTQAAPFEAALRWLGIPYHLVRSEGGLARPEVQDMVNLLEYLTRPLDPFLLTALLRSPLAGVSDETILALAQAGGISLFTGPGASPPPPELDPDQAGCLDRFNQLLDHLWACRDRLGPAELVERALERSDLGAVLLAGFQGPERLANVQAFIEKVRSLGQRPGMGLTDLVERFRPLDKRPGLDLEPPLLEGLDAVRIMTIHKAKGLQFPVVILGQSWQRLTPGPSSPVLIRPGLGLGLKLRRIGENEWRETYSYRRIKEAEAEREAAEADRLLYVALTRAQDLLIVSGPRPGEKETRTWRAGLEAFAARDDRGLIRRVQGRGEWPGPPPRPGPASFSGPTLGRQQREAQRIVERVLRPPRPPVRLEVSVSALEDLDFCPRLYLRRRLLGEEGQGRPVGTPTAALDATRMGDWLHQVLERIDYSRAIDEAYLTELVGSSARQLGLWAGEEQSLAIRADLKAFLGSDLGRFLSGPARPPILREVPFSLGIGLDQGGLMRLEGKIDLVVRAGARPWVVDYKRARPKGEEYLFQMLTYGLALARSGDRPGLKTIYLYQGSALIKELPFGPAEEAGIEQRLVDLGRFLARRWSFSGPDLELSRWPDEPSRSPKECPFFKEGGCCG